MEDHRDIRGVGLVAGADSVAALVPRRGSVVAGAGLVFGAPHVVEVLATERAINVRIDKRKAGSVAHVNGRCVAIDSDHNWVTVPDRFDGLALIVEGWFA